MNWIILIGVSGAVLALVFVLITDGRYFGKPITRWIYNRIGPAMFSSFTEAALWRDLADRLSLRGVEMMLDVGTAVGDLPLTLAARPRFQGYICGVDWSPSMIRAAQNEAKRRRLDGCTSFQIVDLRDGLPFEAKHFDVVFCLGLLETWPHPETMLVELARVLKPEGKLVVSLYRGSASKLASLSFDWYREQLTTLGFAVIRDMPLRRSHDVVVAQQRSLF
jgi:ubiquinone/menaquinone biosynthesis C-methylase UbiE